MKMMGKKKREFKGHSGVAAGRLRRLIIGLLLVGAVSSGFILVAMADSSDAAQTARARATSQSGASAGVTTWPTSFPAQQFNAKLEFEVWICDKNGCYCFIGTTPSERPLSIPSCQIWYVIPKFDISGHESELAAEINSQNIPGLLLRRFPTRIDPVFFQKLEHLQKLALSGWDKETIAYLQGLKKLRELSLGGDQLGEGVAECLSDMTQLYSLRLDEADVSDVDLGHLKKLHQLRELNLAKNKAITSEGLKNLEKMQSLQVLDVSDLNIDDAGLVFLGNLTELRELRVGTSFSGPFCGVLGVPTEITDAGLANLGRLTKLQKLFLEGIAITGTGLSSLEKMQNLQELHLAGSGITDIGLAALVRYKGLIMLDLSKTDITDVGLKRLSGLESLLSLDLSDTNISGVGLEHLVGLKGLQELNLSGTKITDVGLKRLSGLKSLLSLDLSGTNISGVGLEHLVGLKGLQELNLSGTKMDDGVVKFLAECKLLARLNLADTKVSDVVLERLRDLTELQHLDLSGTGITNVGLEYLKAFKKLQTLDLSRTSIDDAGLEFLKECKSLKTLSLGGNPDRLTLEGVEKLKKSIPGLKTPSAYYNTGEFMGNNVKFPVQDNAVTQPASQPASQPQADEVGK